MTKLTNLSGIFPTEFKVLILPVEVGDKIGNLYIPQESKEREQFAQQEGIVVAASPLAFSYASKEEWERAGASPPKAGDKVSFAKFAGFTRKGSDGKTYRIVNDKDICAIVA
jgi:co-chaperonin GroES (HSP10)